MNLKIQVLADSPCTNCILLLQAGLNISFIEFLLTNTQSYNKELSLTPLSLKYLKQVIILGKN